MSEIIQNWLLNQVGSVIDTTPENFGEHVKDGYLIGTILHNHGVIDSNQLSSIKVSDSKSRCTANLKKISEWVKKIDVQCPNSLIQFIASGHGPSALRLFYQLYLTLEDKYRLERFKLGSPDPTENNEKKEESSGTCQRLPERKDDLSTFHLSLPLFDQKDLLKWYKNKYDMERQQLHVTRAKYRKMHEVVNPPTTALCQSVKVKEDKKQVEFSKFMKQVKKYEDTLNKRDKDDFNCKKLDEIDKINSEGFVSVLKERKNKHVFQHNIKDQVQKMLLNELCTEILTKQEKELDHLIATKLMIQSEYEKRMLTKMLEVRYHKHVCVENKRMIDNMINLRQEEEYNKVLLDQMSDVARVQKKADLEGKRAVELHKRLFAERMKKKSEKNYEECQKIAEAFVDMASKLSDYVYCYETNVPESVVNQWKTLYRSCIPLYEDTKDAETKESKESVTSCEDIVQFVKERDEALNKHDYYEYVTNNGNWSLEKLPPERTFSDSYESYRRGEAVLGHIVHKLLLMKYPIPCATTPADLPPFIVSACVIGLEDTSILPIVQELLHKKEILVVEVQAAINYCLEAYKREQAEIDAALAIQQENEQVEMEQVENEQIEIEEENKSNDLEEPTLTQKGLLGQLIDEHFSNGGPIPDCKIVEILIEYLKSLTTSNGWVLIDFPSKLSQAVLLEYKITAKVISKMLLKLNSTESVGYSQASIPLEDPVDDPYIDIRKSNLISSPHPEEIPESFETFLTAYIKVKRVLVDESVLLYMEPDPESALEQFYTDQGVFYSLLYEHNDFEMIKRLVKLIIGDYTLPLKTSTELMGEEIDNIEIEYGKNKRNVKHVEKKKISVAKKKSSEVLAEHNGDQESVSISKLDTTEEHSEIDIEVIDEVCEPGDPKWKYADLSQPSELISVLPTFWENIEKNYIDELNAFFFLKRVYWSTVAPYMSYIRDHVNAFINRPDNKQDYVYKFQQEYNELDEDLRHDVEIKAEFHCRLSILRNTLWSICDDRAMEAEKERQRLIEDNWILDQLVALGNLFISVMQLELNRCADTLQLIHDYYLSMLGSKPDPITKFKKVDVLKIKPKNAKISDDQKEQKDGKEQKDKAPNHSIKQRKRSNVSMHTTVELSSLLIKIFVNPCVHFNLEGTQLDQTLMENYRTALFNIESWSKIAFQSIDAEKDLLDPKKSGKKGKTDKHLSPSQMLLVVEQSENLFKEWLCVVKYEIRRATMQIDLLKENVFKEIFKMFKYTESVFHGLYRDIALRYDKEIKSVAKLCLVLSKAIEEEMKLQPQLALVDDTFLVIGNELLYSIEPRLLPPVVDQTADAEFSLYQLEKLFKILYYTAPTGSISQKAFVYIFEDLIVVNMENSTTNLLPNLWREVCTYDVSKIVLEIFGDVEYIDWRDFIISNFNIPFPNQFQILATLKKLESYDPDLTEHISYRKFRTLELWFETEPTYSENESKIKTIKNILFGMFKSDENLMNYSDFLLHFCKDFKPLGGLVKAVSLALKSLVCWDTQEGNQFMELEKEKQLEKQRNLSFSNQLYANMVESAINESDGIVLKEIYSSSNVSSSTTNQLNMSSQQKVDEESLSYYDISCLCSGDRSMEECLTQGSYIDFTAMLEEKVYYLSFQTVLAVFIFSLPWHMRLQCSIKESIRKELKYVFGELGLPDRLVFAHQFFQHPSVERLLSMNNQFKIVDHADILTKYVHSNLFKKCIQ